MRCQSLSRASMSVRLRLTCSLGGSEVKPGQISQGVLKRQECSVLTEAQQRSLLTSWVEDRKCYQAHWATSGVAVHERYLVESSGYRQASSTRQYGHNCRPVVQQRTQDAGSVLVIATRALILSRHVLVQGISVIFVYSQRRRTSHYPVCWFRCHGSTLWLLLVHGPLAGRTGLVWICTSLAWVKA